MCTFHSLYTSIWKKPYTHTVFNAFKPFACTYWHKPTKLSIPIFKYAYRYIAHQPISNFSLNANHRTFCCCLFRIWMFVWWSVANKFRFVCLCLCFYFVFSDVTLLLMWTAWMYFTFVSVCFAVYSYPVELLIKLHLTRYGHIITIKPIHDNWMLKCCFVVHLFCRTLRMIFEFSCEFIQIWTFRCD